MKTREQRQQEFAALVNALGDAVAGVLAKADRADPRPRVVALALIEDDGAVGRIVVPDLGPGNDDVFDIAANLAKRGDGVHYTVPVEVEPDGTVKRRPPRGAH